MGDQQKTKTQDQLHKDEMDKGRQDPKAGTGTWSDTTQQERDMRQGDYTRPAQPSGTTPLERDQQPVRKER